MDKLPDQGEKKFDLGRGALVAGFVVFTIIFGLVVGRQALDQRQLPKPPTSPAIEEEPAQAIEPGPPDPSQPRVSSQARPKGWLDLKTDDLSEIMALPGMTRSRAKLILELRQSKPDLKLEDLLSVPGITQADLDAWREFIWEGA